MDGEPNFFSEGNKDLPMIDRETCLLIPICYFSCAHDQNFNGGNSSCTGASA